MKVKALFAPLSVLFGAAIICSGLIYGKTCIAEHHEGHANLTVNVNLVNEGGVGASIGTITFSDSAEGLLIAPRLSGLTPGDHGFHIHQNPDCGPKEKDGVMVAALAAGPHYDPTASGRHLGPHGGGHKGDLPKLIVANDGSASTPVVLKGVKLAEVLGRSVMIHAGGDNYADAPAPLGGGGARIACGVIADGLK